MYALFHGAYVFRRWHVVLAYICSSWTCCILVALANRILPLINHLGLFWIVAGALSTITVFAVMPSINDRGYASDRSVWLEFIQTTGYSSDGLVFLIGTLNGAYAFGVPGVQSHKQRVEAVLTLADCISHIAEEVKSPSVVVPAAMFAQLGTGFLSTFAFLVAIFYATPQRSTILQTTSLSPVTSLYGEITGSKAGAFGLLVVTFLPCFWAIIGTYVTAGRMLWSLARDNGTPFSSWLGRISTRNSDSPVNATLTVGIINTLLGLIYLGSTTALNAFAGSQISLLLLSYLAAILPHLLNRRSMVQPGKFWMPEPLASLIHALSCIFICIFTVIYCLPATKPVAPESMNWTSAILIGCTASATAWWYLRGRGGFGANAHPIVGISRAPADDSARALSKSKSHSSNV